MATSNHYDVLRVAPGAEDAVIRAAYRALMRLYHPDTNSDPEAQARVREITAAFAVLGDPERRAAYDASASDRAQEGAAEELDADRPLQPPLRAVGLACVALAVALSLMVVVRPAQDANPPRQQVRDAAPVQPARPEPARAEPLPQREQPSAPAEQIAPPPSSAEAELPPAEVEPHAATAERRGEAQSVPKQDKRPAAQPKAVRLAAAQATASCGDGSSPAGSGKCRDDRLAKVERIAVGFLDQSMAHADTAKQQLLLSARNRSAKSRKRCRSDDCVTEAYLRQIRETSAIMEGRRVQ